MLLNNDNQIRQEVMGPPVRSNRGKRIFQETSEAPIWYLQLWQSLSVEVTAENGIISTIDKSGFLRTFTSTIMPIIASVLIILPIVSTWQTAKNFIRSKNKNFDKALDLFVNVLMTLTSVGVMATLLAGIVYTSTYILLLAMSVSMGYGIYNVVKHAYAAWCARDEGDEERAKQHLWAIPYHIILTVLSGLGIVVQLFNAFNITAVHGIFKIVQISNSSYTVAQILIYAFGLPLTLSTIPVFASMIKAYNAETLKIIQDPKTFLRELIFGKDTPEKHENGLWDRIKIGYSLCLNEPLTAALRFFPTIALLTAELIGVVVVVSLRVIAGVLAPMQVLGDQVTRGVSFLKKLIMPPPIINDLHDDPITIEKRFSTAQTTRDLLIARHAKLKIAVTEEINHLITQDESAKILAKISFLTVLKRKLGDTLGNYDKNISMDDIEEFAMELSPNLYQSFWRQEGRVEKIARQFDELEEGLDNAVKSEFLETPGNDKQEEEHKEQYDSDDESERSSLIRRVR